MTFLTCTVTRYLTYCCEFVMLLCRPCSCTKLLNFGLYGFAFTNTCWPFWIQMVNNILLLSHFINMQRCLQHPVSWSAVGVFWVVWKREWHISGSKSPVMCNNFECIYSYTICWVKSSTCQVYTTFLVRCLSWYLITALQLALSQAWELIFSKISPVSFKTRQCLLWL